MVIDFVEKQSAKREKILAHNLTFRYPMMLKIKGVHVCG